MSAFAAILDTSGAAVDPLVVRSMLDVAPYDRSRTVLWTAEGVLLGAAPLDSPHKQTPHLSTRGDRLCIVMDGRLDEREVLTRQLESDRECDLEAASDVELVLAAYERWGSDCAAHLLGDFSFCVWDRTRQTLCCARDRLGVKPLYYARAGAALMVSNVLRSIRRHPRISARLDDHAIGDVLLIGACMHPSRTSFADIARVPPAHTLTCSMRSSSPALAGYWTLEPSEERRWRDPREYVDGYVEILERVVGDRLRDAPAAVLLSGGLDSSSVATAAVNILGGDVARGRLRAYTFVYDSVAEDEERRYSSLVARHLGIDIEHHPIDNYGWFERWNAGLLPPEPSTEPMTAMTSDLLDRVARHSAVALTGDGGDPAFLPSTVLQLLRHRSPHGLAAGVARTLWRTRSLPPFGIGALVRRWLSPSTEAHVPAWLSDAFVRRCDLQARRAELSGRRAQDAGPRGAAAGAVADPWWTSMFETYDPGATQRPVELRYPLFDVRFIAFALSLPTHPWCVNKTIVRAAMRGRLPDEICVRPKSPLAVDPLHTHGRLTAADIAAAIEAAPELATYIDSRRFTATVRDDGVMTDAAPGTWAAAALATWLRCAAGTNAAA